MATIKNVTDDKIVINDIPGPQTGSFTIIYPGQTVQIFNEDVEKSFELGALRDAGSLEIVNFADPPGTVITQADNSALAADVDRLKEQVGTEDSNTAEGVVRTDTDNKLPALDGSQLTGLPVIAGVVSIRADGEPVLEGAIVLQAAANIVLGQAGNTISISATAAPAADASATVKGVSKLSVTPASPTNPIAAGDNDPRMTDARTPIAHDLAGAEHADTTFAGLNSKITDGTLIDTLDVRLSDPRVPKGGASSDLSGTYPGPTVTKIQGRVISTSAPTPGQTLVWTGSEWAPSTQTGSGPHSLGGPEHIADTLANFNTKITGEKIVGANDAALTDARTPLAHDLAGAEHGADTLVNLNTKMIGEKIVGANDPALTDDRTPTAHDLAGAEHTSDTLVNLNTKITGEKIAGENAVAAKQDSSEKGQASGYASLGGDGKIPQAQVSAIAITDTFVVGNQTERLALTAQTGDVAIQTDATKTFILRGTDPSILGDWEQLVFPGGGGGTVTSVSGTAPIQISGTLADPLVEIDAASGASAGSMSSTDKTKLDGIESGATADQSGAEVKAVYEAEANTNAYTDAEKSKLAGIEALATVDQTGAEIKAAYEAELDTNAYTDAEQSKLAGIATGATGDQTGAEIKVAYEGEGNTNAFTDAEQTKLTGIESSATADQTGAEIKTAYEAEANAFTDAQFTKLAGIATGATADQTGAEIKTAYEAEANAFTDAQFTKLAGIATGATANSGDASLLARANHTGTQTASTISNFASTLAGTTNTTPFTPTADNQVATKKYVDDNTGGGGGGGGHATALVDAPTGVATTDTAAIVAAVAELTSAGGTIVFREGTYVINAETDLPADTPIKVVGQGWSTIIQLDPTWEAAIGDKAVFRILTAGTPYLEFADFKVEGVTSNKALVYRCNAVSTVQEKVRFENIWMRNGMTIARLIAGAFGAGRDVIVNRCRIDGGFQQLIFMNLRDVANVSITNNVVERLASDPVGGVPIFESRAEKRVTITGNKILDERPSNVFQISQIGENLDQLVFANNEITLGGTPGSGAHVLLIGSSSKSVTNGVVTGNTFDLAGHTADSVRVMNSSKIAIVGNNFGTGVRFVTGGSGVSDCVVSGNKMTTFVDDGNNNTNKFDEAGSLGTSGARVNVDAASPPTTGQVLTATGATVANWQTPAGGGGAWAGVASETIITPANGFTVVSGLDLAADGFYKIFITMISDGFGGLAIAFNGDKSGGNYKRTRITHNGSTVTPSGSNTNFVADTFPPNGGNGMTVIEGMITRTPNNHSIFSFKAMIGTWGGTIHDGKISWNTTSNVTSIEFYDVVGSIKIAAGSKLLFVKG